jgi:Cyclic GMP-AMP synthase DncV-like, nucleotidyltransferase domain
MPLDRGDELRLVLHNLSDTLDISETDYEVAKNHYHAVGDWLNGEDSPIADLKPEIYPQGSFRLGTVIKPLENQEDYDIDLVCVLQNLNKEKVNQKELKALVGDRLKSHDGYRKMIEEGKRCWTLHYSDSSHFHMDVLPAIPDNNTQDLIEQVGENLTSDAILITDKELREWQRSNPVGFAAWFKGQMMNQFEQRRIQLAETLRERVEDVPEFKIKTPLQRSIQILKRHRDILFKNDQDDKPISIIITTLAAKIYNNENDVWEALQSIVSRMSDHIEFRDGDFWVPNPVNPYENFADRWQKYPERGTKFRAWIEAIHLDLESALKESSVENMVENLTTHFGINSVKNAAKLAFPGILGTSVKSESSYPKIEIKKPPSKPWRP